jgi:hypothetical protein
MDAAFHRDTATTIRVHVERDDGAILETRSPGATDALPHDLIHFVVERELGLDDGFWPRVARGVKFRNMRLVRKPLGKLRRQPPRPKRPSSEKRGLLEAEVLVGVFHDIWTGAAEREWGTIRAFLDSVWSPRTRSRADELDEQTIRRICDALTEAERAWRRVPIGGELRVTWPTPTAR